MLKFLHIENIAVIESSDIEFEKGFNVLTGETGAGKSIVIDAINAVLGERTSKDLIRTGCDWAEVSAVFGELCDRTLAELAENDIFPDEDGNVIITRKLSLTGKGIIKINGKPSTATVLREISGYIINIHGQHDNQALLNPEKHCAFIDAIAENANILDKYYAEFKKLNQIRRELNALETDEDEKQRKTELLKYQINELEEADIKIGEWAELKNRLRIAENFEKNHTALISARMLLVGDDETDGAITKLSNCLKLLIGVDDEKITRNCTRLNEIISAAQDIAAELTTLSEDGYNEEINPDKINRRLDLLYRLMLKYGNSEQEMLEFLDNARNELEGIAFSEKRVIELSDQLELSKQKLIEEGAKLTNSRKTAAVAFESAVSDILKYLNMPDVKFIAKIESGRYTKTGCDVAEFKISANAGEDVKPLHKIASGGELSRVMLAIKSALLDKDMVDTLIFDEIDTGISGYAADKVGNQLKKVSTNRQVICVTHLAQIAAQADNHLLIEKNTKDGKTFTEVKSIGYKERISEIARIMSGTKLTEKLYDSAKELLDRSLNNENL